MPGSTPAAAEEDQPATFQVAPDGPPLFSAIFATIALAFTAMVAGLRLRSRALQPA